MDLGVAGKVAFVAGASRGMGRATAEALAAEGAAVVMVGRKAHRLDPAVAAVQAAGGSAVGVIADLSRKDGVVAAVAAAREAFGPPDIAVTMGFAMVAERGFENLTDEQYRIGMDDAVMNIVHVAREVVPHMREQGWGRLLNIGSVAMKEPHREDPVLFSNIRVAACGLMKTLSNELGRHGITANVIAPGPVDTEYFGDFVATLPEAINTKQKWLDRVPAGRLGRAEDVGAMAAFLASDRAGWITGQTIVVDGGYNRSLY